MTGRVLYLLGVVAAGWLVTFALRALPFALFAGRDRKLPDWVAKLGDIVSPVIIAGLIVYSYATLKIGEGEAAVSAWKTLWPYFAGLLTVGLQLVWRNPLVSILAGTILYMALLTCGCATQHTAAPDAQHPVVRVSQLGISFDGKLVQPQEVPGLLEDRGVPRDAAVHILLEPEVKRMALPGLLMATLSKAGYTRPILVTKRHAESVAVGKPKPKPKPKKNAKIRYRKANE